MPLHRRFFVTVLLLAWTAGAPAGADPVSVRGRLLGPGGGAVAGATVRLAPAAAETPPVGVRSRADGSFALDVPPGGDWDVIVDVPGFVPAAGCLPRTVPAPGPPSGAGAAPHRVRLVRELAVAGRVLDGRGDPVAGARIAAVPRRDPVPDSAPGPEGTAPQAAALEATSDRDGRFTLAGLAPGVAYDVDVAGEDYARHRRSLDPLPCTGAVESLSIVVESGVAAGGSVLDLDERPVAGAWVELLAEHPDERPGGPAGEPAPGAVPAESTDREGRFSFAAVAPGVYRLKVRADGYRELVVPGVEVTAGEGSGALGSVLLASDRPLVIAVVDPDDRPLPGALVRVQRPGLGAVTEERLRTGADGTVAVRGLPAGARLQLDVALDGFRGQSPNRSSWPATTRSSSS